VSEPITQWTPLQDAAEFCGCADECGTVLQIIDGNILQIDYADQTLSFTLPDGWRLCKRNEGEYITVHRSYIENLEAKIAALSK
jgi:hypothetical protein